MAAILMDQIKKRWPCYWTKTILRELNSTLMQVLLLHDRWWHEWKTSIYSWALTRSLYLCLIDILQLTVLTWHSHEWVDIKIIILRQTKETTLTNQQKPRHSWLCIAFLAFISHSTIYFQHVSGFVLPLMSFLCGSKLSSILCSRLFCAFHFFLLITLL